MLTLSFNFMVLISTSGEQWRNVACSPQIFVLPWWCSARPALSHLHFLFISGLFCLQSGVQHVKHMMSWIKVGGLTWTIKNIILLGHKIVFLSGNRCTNCVYGSVPVCVITCFPVAFIHSFSIQQESPALNTRQRQLIPLSVRAAQRASDWR